MSTRSLARDPQPSARSWLVDDPWALRVSTDTLSWALDLPLQILSASAPDRAYSHWREYDERFARRFPRAGEFYDFLERIPADPGAVGRLFASDASMWERIANDPLRPHWLTEASYAGPLVRLMRDHWLYALWEDLYLLGTMAHTTIEQAPDVEVHDGPGLFSGLCQLGRCRIPELDAYAISFPVMRFSQASATLGQWDTAGQSVVERFLSTMKRIGVDAKANAATMRRFENARAGITRPDLEQRLDFTRRALANLHTLEFPADLPPARANLQRAADAALFTVLMSSYQQLPTDGDPSKKKRLALYFRLLGTRTDISPAVTARALRFMSTPDGEAFGAELLEDCPWHTLETESPTALTGQFASSEQADGRIPKNFLVSPLLRHLDLTYSWYLDGIQTRRNAHEFETFLLLRHWCVDEFGQLSRLARHLSDRPQLPGNGLPEQGELELRRIAGEIAARVARTRGADICTLHHYNHRRDEAIPLGIYHADPEQLEHWQSLLQPQMHAAARSEDMRRESIVYSCIDTASDKVCYAFNGDTGDSDPPQSRVLTMQPPIAQPRSAQAATINVLGRPWGAVNLMGLRPYQFTHNTATALTDLANLLGSHIYNQWLLLHLDSINSAATNDTLSTEERYLRIANYVTDALLASASVIWVQEVNTPEAFEAVAWSNRPDLDSRFRENPDAARPRFVLGSNSSLSATTIANQEIWHQQSLDDSDFPNGWHKKPHTGELRNSGFRNICIIPMYLHGVAIGSISLFNRHAMPYSPAWQHLMHLVSEELALAIQAVISRDEFEKRTLAPLRHELVPESRTLNRAARLLREVLNQEEIRSLESFPRINLYMHDIKHSSHYIGSRVAAILSKGPRPSGTAEDSVLGLARERMKAESGNTTDLRDLLNEISQAVQSEYKHKKMRFSVSGPSRGPFVVIDRQNLRTMLSNLLENAAKYCPDLATVQLSVLEAPHYIELRVINAGRPLSRGESDHIFEREFRGSAAIEAATSGEGLGLYFVKQIATSIYKSISVTYREGNKVGSDGVQHIFSLRFPPGMIRKRRKRK